MRSGSPAALPVAISVEQDKGKSNGAIQP